MILMLSRIDRLIEWLREVLHNFSLTQCIINDHKTPRSQNNPARRRVVMLERSLL
jgi:hypothetical protein